LCGHRPVTYDAQIDTLCARTHTVLKVQYDHNRKDESVAAGTAPPGHARIIRRAPRSFQLHDLSSARTDRFISSFPPPAGAQMLRLDACQQEPGNTVGIPLALVFLAYSQPGIPWEYHPEAYSCGIPVCPQGLVHNTARGGVSEQAAVPGTKNPSLFPSLCPTSLSHLLSTFPSPPFVKTLKGRYIERHGIDLRESISIRIVI
jgi:hypothetical protein